MSSARIKLDFCFSFARAVSDGASRLRSGVHIDCCSEMLRDFVSVRACSITWMLDYYQFKLEAGPYVELIDHLVRYSI